MLKGKKKYSKAEDEATQKLARILGGFSEGYNGKIGTSGGMYVEVKNPKQYK